MLLIIALVLAFVFAGCTETEDNSYSYTINVYDIDEALLKTEVIKQDKSFSNEDKLFIGLKNNFDVEYSESEYGIFITSIEKSIVDPNYYIAIYENGEYCQVGIEDIIIDDKDVFDFKVICWNTEFDEVDLDVDKTIYSFFKNDLDKVFTESNYDVCLMQSIKMMASYGYDKNVFSQDIPAKDKYIEIFSEQLTEANVGTLYKWSLGCDFFDIKNESLKTLTSNITEVQSLLNIFTIQYYLETCEILGIKNEQYEIVLNDFFELVKNSDASDSTCIALQVMKLFSDDDGYEDAYNTALEKLKATISKDGVTETWSGLNCSSTAQGILALVSGGLSPRKYNDCDLIKALFTFKNENGFVNKIDATNFEYMFVFDTPQALQALLVYKVFRDKQTSVSVFKF